MIDLIPFAYLLASAAFWAVWRRIFGGMWHLPRAAIVAVGFIAAAAPFYFSFGGIPEISRDGVLVPLWIVAGGLAMLFWTPGHDFRKNSALWKRYFVVGIPWMLLERFEGTRPLGIGWTELAEYGAGAIFGLVVYGVHYVMLVQI